MKVLTSIEMCEAIRVKLAEYEAQQKENEYLSEHGRWIASKIIGECRKIVISMQMEEEEREE